MKNNRLKNRLYIAALATAVLMVACSKSSSGDGGGTIPPVITPPVTGPASGILYWLTTSDRVSLLAHDTTQLGFGTVSNSLPVINVDSTQVFQSIDGFGYTLTQGSAYVINQLDAGARTTLLNELFGTTGTNIGISYLRIGIGATDLSSSVYSYDDLPAGQTDVNLASFSLASPDLTDLVPLLKEILLVNPAIKIIATPWSAPTWMKDNNSTVGGNLNPIYYDAYANYFVKYIQAMQAQGIAITAVTPQNEPLNPANNPSMSVSATQEATFIKTNLGPAFAAAGITTKIVAYDHNCDQPGYPLTILNDAAANPFVDGSAFHLYAGDISALTQVHIAYPNKNVYFTEQYTASTGTFAGDLDWHVKNVIIGSVRNWSKVALEWNLANDGSFSPHTPGGCNTCQGALTINSGFVSRNVGYYIVAQASRFVPAGSKRIASDVSGNLQTAAFLRPDGKKVLIVLNDDTVTGNFNIKFKNQWVTSSIPGGAVATYVW